MGKYLEVDKNLPCEQSAQYLTCNIKCVTFQNKNKGVVYRKEYLEQVLHRNID